MRKVVAALFMSLDGVVEAPDQWQFDHFDDGMGAAMGAQLAKQDTVLLGRVTYSEWAPYWPTATDEPFASYINQVPKYVFSTTLDKVEWQNSTLVKGDVAETLAELKQQPGQEIGVAGSPTLVRYLLKHDLLDALTLLIHPVVAGKGQRLFTDLTLKRYTLASSQSTSSGNLIVTYQPRR